MSLLLDPMINRRIAALEVLRDHDTHRSLAIIPRAELYTATLKARGRLWFLGMGGCQAIAQHIAAEYVGRFQVPNRVGLPAIALASEAPGLTALANDFGYPEAIARLVDTHVQPQDLLIIHSTSGHGAALQAALEAALAKKRIVVALLGRDGGTLAKLLPHGVMLVPGDDTATIQEMMLFIEHAIVELVDTWMAQHVWDAA